MASATGFDEGGPTVTRASICFLRKMSAVSQGRTSTMRTVEAWTPCSRRIVWIRRML
jgi:hypothetical protein